MEVEVEHNSEKPIIAEKPIDFSKAILEKKMTPNMLVVDETLVDESSTVFVSPAKMEELNLFAGDTVLLKGKKRKETLAIVQPEDSVTDSRVRVSKMMRSNLR